MLFMVCGSTLVEGYELLRACDSHSCTHTGILTCTVTVQLLCKPQYACTFMRAFLKNNDSAMKKLGALPTIFIHVSATVVTPTSTGMTPQVF